MLALKQEYLLNEIWGLTIAGAFQRANIYKDNQSEKLKNEFKQSLQVLIQDIASKYVKVISEEIHVKNIQTISTFEHKGLQNSHLNFGISQKLLNLYLKYLWCLDRIKTPPHFPIDRIIQEQLGITKIEPWTQMKNEKEYFKVINIAKEQAKERNVSLAELELELYKRRKFEKRN